MRLAFIFLIISAVVDGVRGTTDPNQASIAFVILNQPTSWHDQNTIQSKQALQHDLPESHILDIVNDFGDVHGAWAIWPLLSKLKDKLGTASPVQWIFFCEDGTVVNGMKLLELLRKYDASKPHFLGYALRDSQATIIHHFAFIGQNVSKFAYPDFAAGVALSWPLIESLVKKLEGGKKISDFAIDAKHELAMLIWDNVAGLELTHIPEFCTTSTGDSCMTEFTNGDYNGCPTSGHATTNDDVVFAVKTFHEFHKSRVVVVKRTWSLDARNIEFFSDWEDHFIPTITIGVNNTERGHCAKSMGIIKYYMSNHASSKKWLVIADDDTLLSVPRLLRLLNCYDSTKSVIIGERYGFGFDWHGKYGYDYPTGGSSMILTTSAAKQINDQCACPTDDSPDDMILGACAQGLNIPLIHSAALHQARPNDYCSDYLKRLKPISFHKHWENDPYAVYSDWLSENDQHTDQHRHGEL